MVTNSKEYMREWRAKNADKIREYQRNSRYKQYGPSRQAAIDRLGGRCFHCGFDDVRCLDVDHVFGAAPKSERARIGSPSTRRSSLVFDQTLNCSA